MFSKSSNNKPVASPTMSRNNNAPSIIGSDVRIQGNITTLGEIQLDGNVEGNIKSASLIIGEEGSVTGAIVADSVIVRGTVNGQIRSRTIRIEKAANVTGDLWHESLSVEAGAQIEGKLSHGADENGKPLKTVNGTPDKVEGKAS